MLILQIETATSVCSCALSLAGQTIGYRELNQPNVHAEKITLLIDELLRESGKTYEMLQAVAVSMGPGSYTGLRIGVSTAKGLCYALDIPLLSINTLEAMFAGFIAEYSSSSELKLFCPMVDARRMEVYTAVYDRDFNRIKPVAARIIDAYTFEEFTNKGKELVLFGDGSEKFKEIFVENSQIEIQSGFTNSARFLSRLAFEKAQKGEVENTAYFEPFYLKDFVPLKAK